MHGRTFSPIVTWSVRTNSRRERVFDAAVGVGDVTSTLAQKVQQLASKVGLTGRRS
jgi:hypothetical protein